MSGKGKILHHEPDLPVVVTGELGQRPLDAPAVRSLIVGEFHDGHGGARGPLGHRGIDGEADLTIRMPTEKEKEKEKGREAIVDSRETANHAQCTLH
jgi:hypothetical protein